MNDFYNEQRNRRAALVGNWILGLVPSKLMEEAIYIEYLRRRLRN